MIDIVERREVVGVAEQDKIDEKAKDLPDLDPARGRRWDWEKEDLKIEPPPEDEKKPEK